MWRLNERSQKGATFAEHCGRNEEQGHFGRRTMKPWKRGLKAACWRASGGYNRSVLPERRGEAERASRQASMQ